MDQTINFVELDMANTNVKSVKDHVNELKLFPKSKPNIQFKGFNPMRKNLTNDLRALLIIINKGSRNKENQMEMLS